MNKPCQVDSRLGPIIPFHIQGPRQFSCRNRFDARYSVRHLYTPKSLKLVPFCKERFTVRANPTQGLGLVFCRNGAPQNRYIIDRNERLELSAYNMNVRRIVIPEVYSDHVSGKSLKDWHVGLVSISTIYGKYFLISIENEKYFLPLNLI